MKPKITGENEERVGLSVIDNGGVEHLIEMEFDGSVEYHEQDGYPDDRRIGPGIDSPVEIPWTTTILPARRRRVRGRPAGQ